MAEIVFMLARYQHVSFYILSLEAEIDGEWMELTDTTKYFHHRDHFTTLRLSPSPSSRYLVEEHGDR